MTAPTRLGAEMIALGPNDLVPCPSSSARRRHVALAEACTACGTEGRTVRRPSLADIVAARRLNTQRVVA